MCATLLELRRRQTGQLSDGAEGDEGGRRRAAEGGREAEGWAEGWAAGRRRAAEGWEAEWSPSPSPRRARRPVLADDDEEDEDEGEGGDRSFIDGDEDDEDDEADDDDEDDDDDDESFEGGFTGLVSLEEVAQVRKVPYYTASHRSLHTTPHKIRGDKVHRPRKVSLEEGARFP
jgi:hypothetical protein